MTHRTVASAVLTCGMILLALGSFHAQVVRSTNIDTKHSDKVLFERAMKAMKKLNYGKARTLLETLINSNPDSAYVPRAKLLIGDAWYREGVFNQAELEYRDVITFFPHRPEVIEARSKVAAIQEKETSP
jgi:outer membrane protein assembly factor BamD